MEYNPSIVQLPADQKDSPDGRVPCVFLSNHYIHIFQEDKIYDMLRDEWHTNHKEDYGFATFRAGLTIIDETVVQVHHVMSDNDMKTEDMRLVVIKDQMYLKVDNRVFPMWLVSPTRHVPVPVVTMERVPNSTSPTDLEIYYGI